jgi:Xaa-Pro aminopeptidase
MFYHTWPKEEIDRRLENCRVKMKDAGLCGMVITDENNVTYFTGFRTHAPWTTYTRTAWYFLPVNEKPLLLLQNMMTPDAKLKTHSCEVINYPGLYGTDLNEVKKIMNSCGMAEGKVGWELGYEQRLGIPYLEYEELRGMMNNCQFVDGSDILWSLRLVKSIIEVDCIRKACGATSFALEKVFDTMHEGMRETEIVKNLFSYMMEADADKPGFSLIATEKGHYDRISNIGSDRRIEKGDLVWVDCGALYKGYWADFGRAGIVGPVDEERKEYQACVHDVTMKAIKSVKPGITASDLAGVCIDALAEYGFDPSTFDCGRMGHGMGIMSTEPPSITKQDKTVLREGMIINIEPGFVKENGVFNIEENVVVTKDGADILSGARRTLYEIKC